MGDVRRDCGTKPEKSKNEFFKNLAALRLCGKYYLPQRHKAAKKTIKILLSSGVFHDLRELFCAFGDDMRFAGANRFQINQIRTYSERR